MAQMCQNSRLYSSPEKSVLGGTAAQKSKDKVMGKMGTMWGRASE